MYRLEVRLQAKLLSIGTAVVLGLRCSQGSLDGAPKLFSPRSDEQAAALAEKQNESPSRTDDEADLVARLESGAASSPDSQNSQDSGDGSDSAATDAGDDASADGGAASSTRWKPRSQPRPRRISQQHSDYGGNPYACPSRRQHAPVGHAVIHARRIRASYRRRLL